MNNELILAPLERAYELLTLALKQPKTEFTRDAVIQRFEYTSNLWIPVWFTNLLYFAPCSGQNEDIKNDKQDHEPTT